MSSTSYLRLTPSPTRNICIESSFVCADLYRSLGLRSVPFTVVSRDHFSSPKPQTVCLNPNWKPGRWRIDTGTCSAKWRDVESKMCHHPCQFRRSDPTRSLRCTGTCLSRFVSRTVSRSRVVFVRTDGTTNLIPVTPPPAISVIMM